MRFIQPALLGALPLLVAAEPPKSPMDQLKEQGRYYWDRIQNYFPSMQAPLFAEPDDQGPSSASPSADTSASSPPKPPLPIANLSLETWKDILRSAPTTSAPSADAPAQEWFVLLTGGNKTCFGLCEPVATSFNDAAALFAQAATHPHLARLDCDEQSILCNSWAAGPPSLYIFSVPAAAAAKTPVYVHSLNTTTTTPETYVELWQTASYKEKGAYEGYFHPVDGPLARFGAAVPVGYVLWAFSVVPSWVFMIGVSFISRTMMSRRMAPPAARAPAAAGAPPGDAR